MRAFVRTGAVVLLFLVAEGLCVAGGSRLLERMEGKLGDHDSGELKRESAEARAERTVAEELKRRRWTEADLKERAKSDPEKLALVARLRRETKLTLPYLAARLHMGSWKSLNVKLHRWRRLSASHPPC